MARVTPIVLADILAYATDFRKLQLWLAIVSLKAARVLLLSGDVVEGLDLCAADRRFMASSDRWAHHDLIRPRQLNLFVTALATVQELHRLLRALICVDFHTLVATTDTADNAGLLRTPMIPQTIFTAEVRRW